MKVFAIAATFLAGSAIAAQQQQQQQANAAPQMQANAAPQMDAANAPTFGNLLDIMSKVVDAIGQRVPELQGDASQVSSSLASFKQSASAVKVGTLVGDAKPEAAAAAAAAQ